MLDSRNEHRPTMLTLSLLLMFALAAGGCIADEPILEPAREAVATPMGCAQALVGDGVVEHGASGEPCLKSLSCEGGDNCSASSAHCKDGENLAITDISVLDCPYLPEAEPVDPEAETLDDCEVALSEGQTDQACAGSFTCGRVTDACCIEIATCGIVQPTPEDTYEPLQRLQRLRLCARDCENVSVKDEEVVTDCASAYVDDAPYDAPHGIAYGYPCSGDFVCMDGADIRNGGIAEPLSCAPEIAFCEGGVVLGRPTVLRPTLPTIPTH